MDKFNTNKGEFVPVTPELMKRKTVTSYAEFEDFNSILIEKIMRQFVMNKKQAVNTLMELSKHEDLFNEFVAGMNGEQFQFSDTLISVEGFTAKQLNEEYPLSVIGAYNYLKYLREDRTHALKDLKNGLPRR